MNKETPAAVVIFRPDHSYLEDLLKNIGNGRRIYAFLNGECDQQIGQMLSRISNLQVLQSSDNIGLGAGLNAAMSAALEEGFEAMVLFDQDSSPSPSLIDTLTDRWRALCAAGHRIAALGPALGVPSDRSYKVIKPSLRRALLAPDIAAADFLPTSGSLVATQAWAEIGPFREDYFVGGIDVEWGFRAWSNGYASACLVSVEMVHRWGPPLRGRKIWQPQILRQSDLRTYYYLRNSVDLLRRPYVPVRWRLMNALRLAGQIGLLLLCRRFDWRIRFVLGRAFQDGINRRMGVAPSVTGEDAPR